MHILMTGIHFETCILRFHHCVNIIKCIYTNLGGISYYKPRLQVWYSLLLRGYKPVKHVIVINMVGNCSTIIFVYLDIFK